MEKPEKLKVGMLLAGVDICSKEYGKVIKWYNKACSEYDTYHKWDIENNYVRKAKLPNEEEIKTIIGKNQGVCQRCEGSGKLWKDGLAHSPNHQGSTIICGECAGSGFFFSEKELATALSERLGK